MAKRNYKKFKKKQQPFRRFTQIQNIGGALTAAEFRMLRRLSHGAKALRNVALYTCKTTYRETGKYATIKQIDDAMKADPNYHTVSANTAQAIRKSVLLEFKSFANGIKGWKADPSKYTGKPNMPGYLGKEEKRVIEIYDIPAFKNGKWHIPSSELFSTKHGKIQITLPHNLRGKNITYIEITPKQNGRFFEVHYTYEVHEAQMKAAPTVTVKAISCDLGVNNLAACVTSDGESFIIDGRKIKSINQWYNKKAAELSAKKMANGISKKVVTNAEKHNWHQRNNVIKGYMGKAAGILVGKAIELGCDTIIIGKNDGWKQGSDIGKVNNQNFVNIPFNQFIGMVENMCLKKGIRFILNEESYTSQASFFDNDDIPVYCKEKKGTYKFSGRRIHRGTYRMANGKEINADINSALNIMRKADVVDLSKLTSVAMPKKIMLYQQVS